MNQKQALVIDDNAQNMRVLTQLLSRQDVSCTGVLNPIELHNLVSTFDSIDVVFLDLEMPGLDGYTVMEMLRDYFGDIPIIAYTVHVSEMNTVRDSGFDGFLGKPLDNTRFPDQLARIFRGESVWERN